MTTKRRGRTSSRNSDRPAAIREVSATPFINILIYGHPGSGKTRLIGTCPDPKRTLIIHPPTDHMDSIRRSGCQEWEVRRWSEMLEAQEYLRDHGSDWDWVWLDSISLFQDTGLDDIWDDVLALKPQRARYGLDKAEYGVNMFRLGGWIRHTVGAGQYNFGITAHPAEMDNPFEEDPDKIQPLLMPYIQGKNMPTKICGYMNTVGYLRVARDKKSKELRRVLSTELTDHWYGKDQFGAFPNNRMVSPTIPKIVAAVHGTKAEA